MLSIVVTLVSSLGRWLSEPCECLGVVELGFVALMHDQFNGRRCLGFLLLQSLQIQDLPYALHLGQFIQFLVEVNLGWVIELLLRTEPSKQRRLSPRRTLIELPDLFLPV